MDGQVISLGYKEVFGKATLPVLLLVYTFAGLKSYGKRAARSMVSTTRYLKGMETRLHGSEDWLALTRLRATDGWSLMVPKTLYPQPLIQLRALITLLVLNLTARKLKAY